MVADIYLVSLLLTTLQSFREDIPFYSATVQPLKKTFDTNLKGFNKSISSMSLPTIHVPKLHAPTVRMPQLHVAFNIPAYRTPYVKIGTSHKQIAPTMPMPQTLFTQVIKPVDTSQNEPVIIVEEGQKVTVEPLPQSTSTSAPTSTSANLPAPAGTVWPLHGRITTEFGVPEPPYQPLHTGIDISSAHRAGVMAIHPFSSGKVIQIVYSRNGLGNHVVVDHGNGLTSWYCHLNSIGVNEGQTVGQGDVVGYEGRTGVVTGTHLHFEIRKNNVPINPRQFIKGNP
jgi:murein DD-endopeptidase MepM/ murein hydrolase activator NlpD